MNNTNYIGLGICAVIVAAAIVLAIYKWARNTKADLSPRNKK